MLLLRELSFEKLITRGCMRYLELTEFPLIPRDGLQKETEFKQLA